MPTDEKEKIVWVRFEKADINGKIGSFFMYLFMLQERAAQYELVYLKVGLLCNPCKMHTHFEVAMLSITVAAS